MKRFSKPAYLCLSMEMDLKFIQREPALVKLSRAIGGGFRDAFK
jgi:hypothetical protein